MQDLKGEGEPRRATMHRQIVRNYDHGGFMTGPLAREAWP